MFEGILFIRVVLTCRAYLRIFLDSFCLNLFKKANKGHLFMTLTLG